MAFRQIGGIDGRPGVERHHVARRPRFVRQGSQQHLLRGRGIADLDLGKTRGPDAELPGMDRVFAHVAVLQLGDQRVAGHGNLVQPFDPVDHQDVVAPQALQDARLDAHQVGVENAHDLVARARGIGQGTEDVEDGANAQLAPHRRRMLHRAVVGGREHEADTDLVDALGHLARVQSEVRTERLENVGAARLARHRPVAVLGDLGAGGRGNKRRRGRDVEGVRAVSARPAGIQQVRVVRDLHLGGELAHDLRRGGDLPDGLLLDPQSDDDRSDERGRYLAAHDLPHELQHLVVKDFAVLDHPHQRFLRCHTYSPLMQALTAEDAEDAEERRKKTIFGVKGICLTDNPLPDGCGAER